MSSDSLDINRAHVFETIFLGLYPYTVSVVAKLFCGNNKKKTLIIFKILNSNV
jgi:hypothetical protein